MFLFQSVQSVLGQPTLLRTERSVSQQIKNAWKGQKKEIMNTLTTVEHQLQNHIEETTGEKPGIVTIEIMCIIGIWTCLLCCIIGILCFKIYKLRKKKKRVT
jgi:beta-lactamase regulating signal transducer with metallopeptidase domain